jgi:anhydro-N-acetylmuramic acid kinase
MDGWCERHTGRAYDAGGEWAASGQVRHGLLKHLLGEPFFAKAPPKSTGRDLLHLAWVDRGLLEVTQGTSASLSPPDVQATLAEITAACAATALQRYAPQTATLLVCGGGAFNQHLMARLRSRLPAVEVVSTTAAGVPPDQVEALAFAWLARAFTLREPGNLPAVTGASGPRVLGAWYPA